MLRGLFCILLWEVRQGEQHAGRMSVSVTRRACTGSFVQKLFRVHDVLVSTLALASLRFQSVATTDKRMQSRTIAGADMQCQANLAPHLALPASKCSMQHAHHWIT